MRKNGNVITEICVVVFLIAVGFLLGWSTLDIRNDHNPTGPAEPNQVERLEARVTCLEDGHEWVPTYHPINNAENRTITLPLGGGYTVDCSELGGSDWMFVCELCKKVRFVDKEIITDEDKKIVEDWCGLEFPEEFEAEYITSLTIEPNDPLLFQIETYDPSASLTYKGEDHKEMYVDPNGFFRARSLEK